MTRWFQIRIPFNKNLRKLFFSIEDYNKTRIKLKYFAIIIHSIIISVTYSSLEEIPLNQVTPYNPGRPMKFCTSYNPDKPRALYGHHVLFIKKRCYSLKGERSLKLIEYINICIHINTLFFRILLQMRNIILLTALNYFFSNTGQPVIKQYGGIIITVTHCRTKVTNES